MKQHLGSTDCPGIADLQAWLDCPSHDPAALLERLVWKDMACDIPDIDRIAKIARADPDAQCSSEGSTCGFDPFFDIGFDVESPNRPGSDVAGENSLNFNSTDVGGPVTSAQLCEVNFREFAHIWQPQHPQHRPQQAQQQQFSYCLPSTTSMASSLHQPASNCQQVPAPEVSVNCADLSEPETSAELTSLQGKDLCTISSLAAFFKEARSGFDLNDAVMPHLDKRMRVGGFSGTVVQDDIFQHRRRETKISSALTTNTLDNSFLNGPARPVVPALASSGACQLSDRTSVSSANTYSSNFSLPNRGSTSCLASLNTHDSLHTHLSFNNPNHEAARSCNTPHHEASNRDPQAADSSQQEVAPSIKPVRQKRKLAVEDISGHFHLPIIAAAQSLGVCTTVLKRACRRFGIQRWPYRKFVARKELPQGLGACSLGPPAV
eukprot:jgi/Mesvir1/20305/Mv19901-RA.1